MNLISFARRAAAVAIVLGSASASVAADTPVVAPPVMFSAAAPCPTCAAPAGVPCGPTCRTGAAGCRTCIPGRIKLPYQTRLCPGACFGYFQTQWSRWDEVCPLPYQGQGFTDAPAQRTTPVTPVRPPAEVKKMADPKPPTVTDPKPMDPKFNKDANGSELPPPRPGGTGAIPMGRGTTLPPIPAAPNSLPIPTGRFGS